MDVVLTVQVGEQMKRMPGGSGNNPFAQLIEDAEGLDKIEALQVRYADGNFHHHTHACMTAMITHGSRAWLYAALHRLELCLCFGCVSYGAGC